ncbi:MAG: vitamin K epoxide reductase family protein [Candidatus Eremiobacteraeota bacterium]|nr:vitamin K epoxide reductase family protein [Candidatus Eremiobacteraeota bacterium]
MPVPELTVFLLCAVGIYASAFMARKARRAARGELTEPSVVHSSAARLVGGVPNAMFGLIYYPCVALAVALPVDNVRRVAFGASLLAAAMSLYLAYSLLFRTKRPCPYCWTAHAVNWILPFLLWSLGH